MAVVNQIPEPVVRGDMTPGRSGAPLSPAIAFAIASTLAVVLPALLVAYVDNVGRSSAWVVTLGVMVWAGLRLSALCVSGQPRLFNYFFWLFVYIFMGLAPTAQMRADLPSTTTPGVEASQDLRVALIVVLGIVCFEIGTVAAVVVRSNSRARADQGGPPSRRYEVNRARTLVLTVVGLMVTAFYINKMGLSTQFSSRIVATATRAEVWPDPAVRFIVHASAIYPTLIAAGALAQLRLGDSKAWRRVGWIGMILCAVVLLVAVSPMATARYTFGTVAFALAVHFGAVRTRLRVQITMLGTLMAFLFIFPLAEVFRAVGSPGAVRTGFFEEYLSNPDYDAFWQISNADMLWREGLVAPLSQLSGSLFFWVPRSIWPDKPIDTGPLLAQYRGYTNENLSAPIWAEGLVNGGFVFMVILFLVLGYALYRMDGRLADAFTVGGVWAIAGAVFPVYMTILLRGSWLQATGALIVAVVCTLFVAGPRTDKPPPQPTQGRQQRSGRDPALHPPSSRGLIR